MIEEIPEAKEKLTISQD